MRKKMQLLWLPAGEIFNLREEEARGRVIGLVSALLASVYSVFVSGIFYTGFLTMYGMSVTDVGILTFLPFGANMLSIFSPKVLGCFKRRKPVLIGAKIFYYFITTTLITIMPQIVHGHRARLVSLIVITTFATGFNALFSPGITSWFYHFYPKDTDKRALYLMLQQFFTIGFGSIVTIGSSLITDALEGSAMQDQLILFFRYFALVLVLVDVLIQSRAKEYAEPEGTTVKLLDVFTVPVRNRKFLACMLLLLVWTFTENVKVGVWNYFLINEMGYSYTIINAATLMYFLVMLVVAPIWQKVMRNLHFVRTLYIGMLLLVPTELMLLYLTPETSLFFVLECILQNAVGVGIQQATANILYMNMPMENSVPYISCYAVGQNALAFLGMMIGTFLTSLPANGAIDLLGREMSSVQITTLVKAGMYLVMGIYLIFQWRIFTPKEALDIIQHRRLHKKTAS